MKASKQIKAMMKLDYLQRGSLCRSLIAQGGKLFLLMEDEEVPVFFHAQNVSEEDYEKLDAEDDLADAAAPGDAGPKEDKTPDAPEQNADKERITVVLPVWSSAEAALFYAAHMSYDEKLKELPLKVWNEKWVDTLVSQKIMIAWQPLKGSFETSEPVVIEPQKTVSESE